MIGNESFPQQNTTTLFNNIHMKHDMYFNVV